MKKALAYSPLLPLFMGVVSACVIGATEIARGAEVLPDESQFLDELPAVLSVSRLRQPLSEAPGTVTVIDREMIKASGARQIADLLRLVPGFQVAYVRGHEPVVAYHGMSGEFSNRMQVLIDGRSILTPNLLGGPDWLTVPLALDDIERIEVVQGSNSAAYGANAYLGIINIITRHSEGAPKAKGQVTLGNAEIADGIAHLGLAKDDLSLRLTAGTRGDNGLETYSDRGLIDRYRVNYANLRADWRPNATDEWTLATGGLHGRRGQGTNFGGDPPRSVAIGAAFAHLRWQRTLSARSDVSLQYYHNYDRIFDPQVVNLPGLGSKEFHLNFVASRDHLEFQHTLSPAADLRAVWGLEARRDTAQSQLFFNSNREHSATLARTFGHVEWAVRPDTLFNLGATTEDSSLTGTDIAPRLSLIHHLTPAHTLRYAVTRALRSPTIGEEEAIFNFTSVDGTLVDLFFLGNPGLRPEKIIAHEIGYVGEVRRWGLSLNARLFTERLEDVIVSTKVPTGSGLGLPDPDGEAFSFANGGSITTRGLECQARLRLSRDTWLIANQAFQRIYARVTDQVSDNKQYEESAPRYTTSLLFHSALRANFSASAAFYYLSRMHWLGFGEEMPPHSRFDFRLARTFKDRVHTAELALVLQNAFDRSYNEFRSENEIRRRIMATLTVTF